MDIKLKKGDSIMLRFKNANIPYGYALCTYSGKRKEKHIFISDTYGWKYIIDIQAGTIICDYSPEIVYEIDNSTGWLRFLPQ